MRDINQKMRFNDAELSLLKALFAGNEELLFTIRKVLLQFKLTEQEGENLKKLINDTTFSLLKKVFLPELDADAPLFQLTDMALGLSGDIKDKAPEFAAVYIKIKQIEIDYISQQMKVLEGKKAPETIKFSDMSKLTLTNTNQEASDWVLSAEEVYVNVLARNYILSYVDTNIQQIKYLSGLKEETVSETKARLAKDSSK